MQSTVLTPKQLEQRGIRSTDARILFCLQDMIIVLVQLPLFGEDDELNQSSG